MLQPPRRPRTWLLGWKAPEGRGRDLVLLIGEAQPPGHAWELAKGVIEAGRQLGVKRVVTFAAMAAPIDPGARPRVLAATSDRAIADEAARRDIQPLPEGEIGGLNGLLVGAGAEAGIPGLCLLGEFPYFAHGFPNPGSSAATLRAFSRLSGVELDLRDLESDARVVDAHLAEIARQAKDVAAREGGSDDGGGPDLVEAAEPEAPAPDAAAQARLDAMFEAARRDRGKALELKAELDRLGLFREHEDRFLDLFRQGE